MTSFNKILKIATYLFIFFIFFALLLSGCQSQSKGFALPEGSAEDGKVTFMRLDCDACHSVSDIARNGIPDEPDVPLGGEVSKAKTYGDLVTSIINPSHKISKSYIPKVKDSEGNSRMMIYNQFMTVQELVDLVTFLQEEYDVVTPPNDYYRHYY